MPYITRRRFLPAALAGGGGHAVHNTVVEMVTGGSSDSSDFSPLRAFAPLCPSVYLNIYTVFYITMTRPGAAAGGARTSKHERIRASPRHETTLQTSLLRVAYAVIHIQQDFEICYQLGSS